MSKPAINWANIERLILKSFTGGDLNERDQALVEQAYRADPAQYRMRHAAVCDEERARLRSL